MKTILLILIILCTTTSFAENKLARINDPDGYTNVRSGRGNEFSIITTIDKDDLFYCENTNAEWLSIIALRWKDSKQIEGFIHRSKVQFIEALENNTQKELLMSILIQQQILAENYIKACDDHDDLMHQKTVEKLESYGEIQYSPILEILPKYFCATKDTSILQQLFKTIWADAGSANESPSFALGESYICKPSLVLAQLKHVKNVKQRKFIFDNIEWGLLNHYNVDEDGISEDKDFNRLKNLLDVERKKACPQQTN